MGLGRVNKWWWPEVYFGYSPKKGYGAAYNTALKVRALWHSPKFLLRKNFFYAGAAMLNFNSESFNLTIFHFADL